MTSAEFRELALITSEDFDGRLHTYAIGIKLALGPNLQDLRNGAKLALDQTFAKLVQSQCPDWAPGCRPNICFGGLDGSPASYIFMRHKP